MTPRIHIGLVAGFALLFAIGAFPAYAQTGTPTDDVMGTINLTITENGIEGMPDTAEGGFYRVTVTNNTNDSRGLVLTGIDLCCSPYIRFTEVLSPGQTGEFEWYFPDNRMVQVRDLLQCKPYARTCGAPVVGSFGTTAVFT